MKIYTYKGHEPTIKHGTVEPAAVMHLLHRQLDVMNELAALIMLVREDTQIKEVVSASPAPAQEEEKP